MIRELMEQKHITKYRLSKNQGIPYTTINDICNGKTQLNKCTAETVYKIAKELDVSMESLIEPYMAKRNDFDLYRSNVCHRVKELGDIEFIIETLERDDISKYYRQKWYCESLYLLAMLDYLSTANSIPLCTKFNDLRNCRLSETVYPSSVLAAYAVTGDETIKERACREAIPEFLHFNIVESEVRDVI